MASSSWYNSSSKSCIICSTKYNRIRSSLCQCHHCLKPFCFDCMRDHSNEIQENIEQLFNPYNELKQLIIVKQKMITNETTKSKSELKDWLEKLIYTFDKLNIDIDNEEKLAKAFVSDIEKELFSVTSEIEVLRKNKTFEIEQMGKLSTKLNELTQRLISLSPTREVESLSTTPKYKFKFNFSSKIAHEEKSNISENPNQSNHKEQWGTSVCVSNTDPSTNEKSNYFYPNENYFSNREKFEPTSYVVDCMASDGINIIYSTLDDAKHNRIAYCYLNVNDPLYRQADPSRLWFQSPIVDMVWWKTINKFVCATEKGIYTVEYLNEHFKILSIINNHWTNVRVAVNTNFMWIYSNGKIMVYNIQFQLVKTLNFNCSTDVTRLSFCITDNHVAFLVVRRDIKSFIILQVQFYDMNMNTFRSFDLGSYKAPSMIRTGGTDHFYITDGTQRTYKITSKGHKKVVNLGKPASSLTIVNHRNFVVTDSRSDLELVKC